MHKQRSSTSQNGPRAQAGVDNRSSRAFRSASGPKREVASALKTHNFKTLANVAGVGNLALALGMPLPRVNELLEGFNFSDETAHHIELTLGLTSGFIDQVNPRLTEMNRQRLHSPLVLEEETPPAEASRAAPSLLNNSKERTMPAKSKENELASPKTTVSKKVAAKPAAAAAPTVVDEETLREVRRGNLKLLTTEQGFKSELGRITGMSPANISHRLHGNKHFDEETGQFFSSKLGLPSDWFNTPHKEKDIPAAVLARLRQKTKPSAARPATPVKVTSSIATSLGSTRSVPSAGLSLSAAVLSSNSGTSNKPAVSAKTAAPRPPAAPARAAASDSGQATLVLESRPSEVLVSAAPAEQSAESSVVLEVVRSGEPLGAVAEALVKTLAAKARQGRLTEEKAFQLLTSAMAL